MSTSTQGTTNPLVKDPGAPAKPKLAARFVSSEIRNQLRLLSIRLGFRKLYDAVPADWEVPDNQFAQQAVEYAQQLCPEFMVRHCFRSYCFGAIVAARNNMNLDRETFFVASMLHDLGLCDKHANDVGSFEWVGAKLAHDFSIENKQQEQTAVTIHNTIALHTSLGIAHLEGPEIAMLHFGTSMDLFGMRIDEIQTDTLRSVLDKYPRSGFKAEFSPCLVHQAESKPNSHIAGAVGVGIVNRIKETL